jgi:4-hydroxy-4-methyl-2-oxoglutarate aldolase
MKKYPYLPLSLALFVLLTLAPASILRAAEKQAPKELKYNSNTWHPAVDYLKSEMVRATDEQLEALEDLPLETVWGVIRGMGYEETFFPGMQTTQPGKRLVGRAVTIRYLPKRPDLDKAMEALAEGGGWSSKFHTRAAESSQPGDVLVVDMGGKVEGGVFFGDISALGAQMSGALGAILWGSTRDLDDLKEMHDFPVYAMGFHPSGATQNGVDWNVPIRVGDAAVLPGDIVLATDEAVLFFPASIADEVIEKALKHRDEEDYKRELVKSKKYRFRDVYPLRPDLKKEYEEKVAKKE